MPVALSDNQLDIVMRHAEPLPATDRHRYLHSVASLLHDVEIGYGTVSRAARQAQKELSTRLICTALPAKRDRWQSFSGAHRRQSEGVPIPFRALSPA